MKDRNQVYFDELLSYLLLYAEKKPEEEMNYVELTKDVLRHLPLGGAFDHLKNYLLLLQKSKKVTETTLTSPLAAWPTIDQHSCNFKHVGGVTTPTPTNKHIARFD